MILLKRHAERRVLADTSIGTIIVENRDRLTRFGAHYIETLLATQGRHLEIILPGDTGDELVDDFVSVITSMAARIYGRRQSKRRAEKIKACMEQVMREEEEDEKHAKSGTRLQDRTVRATRGCTE